jgi:hypothetical protein
MDKWRVGDDTRSKETDGCPLTGLLVWKSSALGVIPRDGTEVRRGSTYEQGESRRGERR